MNPEEFLQLDRVIHEKGRLAIMSLLAGSADFNFRLSGFLRISDFGLRISPLGGSAQ